MRAALGWSFSREESELGLRLAAALWEFWDTHGHLGEGRRWLERGIASTGPTMSRTKARALIGAGWIALFQGDYEAAKALVEESLILYQGFRDDEGIASSLANLGFVAIFAQRNLESVPALLEDAMRLRPKVKDQRTVAYLLIFEGLAMAGQLDAEGRFGLHNASTAAQVRALHEQGLALFREIGDARGIDICLTNLGLLELIVGNHTRATVLLRENLYQTRQLDDKLHTQFALFGLAGVAASQDQPLRATRLWAAAETVRETSGIQLHPLALTATDYEGRQAAVRAELGTEAFERAWTEGRMMALEQAVEYALSDEEPDSLTASAEPGYSPDSTRLAPLTRREREVANLVGRGLTNRQIAEELYVSERTVDHHVANILKKLKVQSREQVALRLAGKRSDRPDLA
jgi:DNA-binding CsgD family transcriptional regulator/tetratricopeptide (TPR) repeat protein